MSTVPQGYKQTEIGVIPEDWEECTIGALIEFEGGSQPDKSFFKSSWKRGYIRLIQIRDYKTDKYETYVPTHLARRFCTEQDIMIGRYGPPVFQILRGIEGAYNVALIKAKPSADIYDTYAYYFLKQDKLFDFIEKLSQRSSGQTGVDLKELRDYPLPLPSYTEQQLIATALSDTDALIESLEKLIAKKRQIKQGAMQKLLTPKEGWEVKKLGEIIKSTQLGGNYPNSEKVTNSPLIKMGNIQRGFISVSKLEYIPENCILQERDRLIYGDVLFNTRNTLDLVGKVSVWRNEISVAYFNSNLLRFEFNQKYVSSNILMNYIFNTKSSIAKLKEIATGTTSVAAIYTRDLLQIEISLPPLMEQTAIATILSDMDAEITALESRLEKTRTIKSGMMHELLTGRIRLI